MLATHGQLQGLLTKKDAAFVMNNEGHGIVREGAGNQGRGLLGRDRVGRGSVGVGVGGGEEEDEDDAESAISSDPLTGL